jgi:hypothetical protein
METPGENSSCTGRDSNWTPPEFKPTEILRDGHVRRARCDLGRFYMKRNGPSKVWRKSDDISSRSFSNDRNRLVETGTEWLAICFQCRPSSVTVQFHDKCDAVYKYT